MARDRAAVFDGVNDGTSPIVTTGLSGGIGSAGTIVAWVDPASLPSGGRGIRYIAGDSQVGNDLDLQFEGDDAVRFYTGGGENTACTPTAATLVGNWHMIAATFDVSLGADSFRNIYRDGALGTGYTGGVDPAGKVNPFTIGYSPLFANRSFDGAIAA